MSAPAMVDSGAPRVVIAVAPTGARKTKADHPNLPISSSEIAAESAACLEAGASMIHLHVRDADDQHTLAPAIYRDAIEEVRRVVGDALVLQMTSEAVGRYTADEQIDAVEELKPEAVSVAVREIVPDSASEERAAAFFAGLADHGVLPQFILYAPEEVTIYADLCKRSVIPNGEHSVLFVLGRYTSGQQSSPMDLLPFVETYNRHQIDVPWMVCAFGHREAECMATAISLGGHARVGFENNQLRPDGYEAENNVAAVANAAAVVRALGRATADGAAARGVLAGAPPNLA